MRSVPGDSPTPAYADVDPSILDAIKKVKPSDYPSANTVTVLDDQDVVYQPDGQFTNTCALREARADARRQDRGGVDARSTTRRTPRRWKSSPAQVIKKDGTVVPVDKKDIQDVEQSGEMNIYDPQGRAMKVTFPNLAVGDVVDITFKLTRITPTRVGYFNDIFCVPVDASRCSTASYTVDGPASLPLTSQIYHPERTTKIETSKTKAGDRMLYKWARQERRAARARDRDELLDRGADARRHHRSELAALLEVVGRARRAAARGDARDQGEGQGADEGREDRRREDPALYDFVAQDIRYRGLGVGPRTGYTPRKAQRDVHVALGRLPRCLDPADLDAARERASRRTRCSRTSATRCSTKIAYDGFNHAIVAMPKKGGGWTYVDPTAKNNNALLPGNEAEQHTLVATLEGRAADEDSGRRSERRTSATRSRRRRSPPTAR